MGNSCCKFCGGTVFLQCCKFWRLGLKADVWIVRCSVKQGVQFAVFMWLRRSCSSLFGTAKWCFKIAEKWSGLGLFGTAEVYQFFALVQSAICFSGRSCSSLFGTAKWCFKIAEKWSGLGLFGTTEWVVVFHCGIIEFSLYCESGH
ncbi:hypothetical protein CTI12_AA246980 [Artemisia annua]|uniref:Uncharacterized protein n=1 Tax=Artemisia annua TaxID=35608 RepID=A0A2U1MNZ6_ARTAN|nr:hypothetical protein CTI12_AA246980 [Artemisia annua]